MHVRCIFILFLLQPTKAQIYRMSHSLPDRHFFYNSNTNEDIATKFEQHML